MSRDFGSEIYVLALTMETFVALKQVSGLRGDSESGNLMRGHNQEESTHNSICTWQDVHFVFGTVFVSVFVLGYMKRLQKTATRTHTAMVVAVVNVNCGFKHTVHEIFCG